MDVDDDVPNDCKGKPGDEEGGGEAQQRRGPAQVDHRREEIFQESEKNVS